MIVRYLTNSTPTLIKGLATKIVSNVIRRADDDETQLPPLTFNINDYDCCYKEYVFADLSETSIYYNDKSSFLFNISIPSDSVDIKLFKDGEEIATLNDGTYGQYFPPSFFPDQLKIGFNVDWKKVLTLEGAGCYQIKADRVIINRNSTLESHHYILRPFDEFLANETCKIRVLSSGYIEGGIDYSDFVWEQEIRVRGKFWNPQATFESDNYQDTKRRIQQIQDQITTTYDLELEPLPVNIAKPLIYDRILGNEIEIYDYNLFNYDRYVGLKVYPTEISESVFHNRTGNGKFTFKFTDKRQNIIKRNFK